MRAGTWIRGRERPRGKVVGTHLVVGLGGGGEREQGSDGEAEAEQEVAAAAPAAAGGGEHAAGGEI